ncbi:MAG TPA: hypothetical protein VE684_11585 [Crenalkalicoccus sp.]|nr:hypothetical protein [Crenalkalicoccus sp.]
MAASPQATAPRARLEQEYSAAFLPYGLVPVLLPRGQDVGDVIASLDGGFVARADECFKDLVPREAESSLTAVDVSWNAAAQIALGVEAVAAAEAQGRAEDRVQVRFEQVTSRSASLAQLRSHVRPGVLPEVTLLLAADAVEFERAPDWLLVSEVLSAVTVVRVARARGGGGKAELSFLGRLFGAAAKAEGGGNLASAERAEIRTQHALPVAFRPARVRVTAEIAGAFRAASGEEFNARDEAHRRALGDWVMRQLQPVGSNLPPRPGPGR